METKLPPLPEPTDLAGFMPEGFTDEQMAAYGAQCYAAGVAAGREQCAQFCDSNCCCGGWLAKEIRKGAT